MHKLLLLELLLHLDLLVLHLLLLLNHRLLDFVNLVDLAKLVQKLAMLLLVLVHRLIWR